MSAKLNHPTPEQIRSLYERICRDSGFELEFDRAAQLVAGALNIHPIDVWTAVGTVEGMKTIANGAQKSE